MWSKWIEAQACHLAVLLFCFECVIICAYRDFIAFPAAAAVAASRVKTFIKKRRHKILISEEKPAKEVSKISLQPTQRIWWEKLIAMFIEKQNFKPIYYFEI